MCGRQGEEDRRGGKSQACSQLGDGKEGLDIKGWAGQLPAPMARWPLSGQAWTQFRQWGVTFTFRPTGVTAEPRHNQLHDKVGWGEP